jgi:release factor glutamine methyltransferase
MKNKKELIPLYEQQLILAHILGMSREYVLAHPEAKLTKSQETKYQKIIKCRQNNEPIAYILGEKEFYGLNFKVTADTLIPRPETEMLVEKTLGLLHKKLHNNTHKKTAVIDIGTGSGNIIISVAKNITPETQKKVLLWGIDISQKALRVAKHNAIKHKLGNPLAGGIKFAQSDLLEYFLKNNSKIKNLNNLIFVANLPYLSKNIYEKAIPDVKNFEPKSALYSPKEGLDHYEKLFQQIKILKGKYFVFHLACFIEFSPEQKPKIKNLIEKYFPAAEIKFEKDLAGKWRIASFEIG